MSTAARLRALVGDVARATRGHDLALYAAGVTFYAAIGFVPLLLLALYLAGLIAGADLVRSLAYDLSELLPTNLGAKDAGRFLADAGTGLGPGPALVSLIPATLYGEGLVRAFDRLSRRRDAGLRSLRGRLGSLLLVAASPLLLLVGLTSTRALVHVLGDGAVARAAGIYFAFLVGWITISLALLLSYRQFAAERAQWRGLLWGAFGTGSVLSGTCLGFVLFLNIEIDIGAAYGGATAVAAAAVSLGWVYLLHVIVLVGYVLTLRIEARDGHPLAAPADREPVRLYDSVRSTP